MDQDWAKLFSKLPMDVPLDRSLVRVLSLNVRKVKIASLSQQFVRTQDPLRAMEILAICTEEDPSIPLPEEVAQYFNRAAIDVLRIARDSPKNGADQIAKVFGFEARRCKRYVGFRHYRGLEKRANACLWVFQQVVEKELPWGEALIEAEAKFKLSSVTIREYMAEALPKGKETWPEKLSAYRPPKA